MHPSQLSLAVLGFSQVSSLHLGDQSGFDTARCPKSKLVNLSAEEQYEQDKAEEAERIREKKAADNHQRDLRRLNRSSSLPSSNPVTVTPRRPCAPSTPKAPLTDNKPNPPKQYMAPTVEDKLFCGDYSVGEKPHIWFRCLEGKFDDETKLATKLYRFTKGLEPGRPTEVWYNGLKDSTKHDWDIFYREFTERWPLPTIIEPSREELLEKLSQTKLDINEVGVMMEKDGDCVYSHILWAEEVKALIDILDDTKGHLIPQVRCNLPLPICLILPTTWSAFFAAVTAISMDRLADQ